MSTGTCSYLTPRWLALPPRPSAWRSSARWPGADWAGPEGVAPAKRRAPGHLQPLGHPRDAQALAERLGVCQPFARLMQAAQRRARQRVEGACAATAQKALQASGKAPLDDVGGAAMGVEPGRLRLDGFNGGLARLQRGQLGLQSPALVPAQLGNGLAIS
ncbi:hypothetical protein [Comamonas testosteroni]|uniref:hypothetical protein n=1 Tax=Comamonas testosteroni TaxID=285 RepID=UPI0026F21485|nr:hypothetical protein [Comamonas testosteroni]